MEQFRVAIPESARVEGWLYDIHSGLCMGIGSYEQKEKFGFNTVFTIHVSGCPHKVIVHSVIHHAIPVSHG